MEENFKNLIQKFNTWYSQDIHKVNIDYYDSYITKEHLEKLAKKEFLNFFIEFRNVGGKVQSLGHRGLDKFAYEIKNNYLDFRSFIMEPFNLKFDLESWFNRIENHKYFGVGIASIYLNRVNRDKYSIINSKTISSLKLLGFELLSSKNYKNYLKVNSIQKDLIINNPVFENLYKIDSFNHYIIGTNEGQESVNEYLFKNDLVEIQSQSNLTITQKENLILCRIGQGNFRNKLIKLWGECSVTGFKDVSFLIASHIKPWKNSKSNERLDKFNGFLLTPNLDKAFDNGLISFDDFGNIIISKKFKKAEKLGINKQLKIELLKENKPYLKYHRKEVFKK